jgi:SAM-dependent MidA family methyltransferase
MDAPRPWREAWQSALYAVGGFYTRAEGPAGHFTTAAHGATGALLATAVAELADQEGCTRVVDLGCGRGELLHHLAAQRPDLALTGVDVVERPHDLPQAVGWLVSPGGADLPGALRDLADTLVVANEWLDVVPCTIARFHASGDLREVLVDGAGVESLGGPVGAADAAWVERWWPRTAGRVEVGRQRDDAWDDLLSRIRSGAAVAVDYGHTRDDRPALGSLQAYARGVLTEPVPDGSCDLTAHVAVDSLTQDRRTTQREAFAGLVGDPHPEVTTDPHGHLRSLARASALATLRDPGGLGAFHWVHQRV